MIYSQGAKYKAHTPFIYILCPWQTSLIHLGIVLWNPHSLRSLFNSALWASHYQVIRTGKQDTPCLPALSFPV